MERLGFPLTSELNLEGTAYTIQPEMEKPGESDYGSIFEPFLMNDIAGHNENAMLDATGLNRIIDMGDGPAEHFMRNPHPDYLDYRRESLANWTDAIRNLRVDIPYRRILDEIDQPRLFTDSTALHNLEVLAQHMEDEGLQDGYSPRYFEQDGVPYWAGGRWF